MEVGATSKYYKDRNFDEGTELPALIQNLNVLYSIILYISYILENLPLC